MVEVLINLAIFGALHYVLVAYLSADYNISSNDYIAQAAFKVTGIESAEQVTGLANLGPYIAYTMCELVSLIMVLAFICDAILKKRFMVKTGQQCPASSLMSKA